MSKCCALSEHMKHYKMLQGKKQNQTWKFNKWKLGKKVVENKLRKWAFIRQYETDTDYRFAFNYVIEKRCTNRARAQKRQPRIYLIEYNLFISDKCIFPAARLLFKRQTIFYVLFYIQLLFVGCGCYQIASIDPFADNFFICACGMCVVYLCMYVPLRLWMHMSVNVCMVIKIEI